VAAGDFPADGSARWSPHSGAELSAAGVAVHGITRDRRTLKPSLGTPVMNAPAEGFPSDDSAAN
jgi:hypothetical protein